MTRHLARSLAPAAVAAAIAAMSGCATMGGRAEGSDHLPSGELTETNDRAVLPQGFVLRPVYAKGIAVTKVSEGWVAHLYNDAARYCTIGYGHLVKKAPCDGAEPPEFRKGLTRPAGESLLLTDMGSAQFTVMTAVRTPLSDSQYAALTDFVFNVGSAKFRKSTLLKVVNARQWDEVPAQLRR